jgi:hypothetical protein
MKTTKRERNLLYFLLFVATITLTVVLVIMPLQSSIDSQKATKSNLETQKALIEVQLAAGTGMDAKISDALAAVETAYAKIQSPISSEEFEQKILPVLVLNDIRIKSWIVNDPVVTKPNLPTFEKENYLYKIKELVDSYNGIVEPESRIPITETQLVMTNVNFSFTSTYADYVEVLDAIRGWDSTIFVSTSTRDYSTGEAIISIDFYSIEKP